MIHVAAQIALAILGLALLLALTRLVRARTPDRVVALDLMTSIAVCASAVFAVLYEESWFLDVAIVLSLVAFVATVAFARYVEVKR